MLGLLFPPLIILFQHHGVRLHLLLLEVSLLLNLPGIEINLHFPLIEAKSATPRYRNKSSFSLD